MKNFYVVSSCFMTLLFSVHAQSQTPETVVGWLSWANYIDYTADLGIPANRSITSLSAPGAGSVGFSDVDGNGTSQRAFAGGWASGANSKAWQFRFNTVKYNSLTFSCRMSGTNTVSPSFLGPRDFQLQYSLNGSGWINVTGGALQAGNGYNTFNSLNNLALPASCYNQPNVYLRMLMTSNTAVNGGTTNTGQSHIDDVVVTGVSIPEAPSDIKLSNSTYLLPNASATAPPSTFGTLSFVDFNLGNTVTYSLVTGMGSTANASFSIAGNVLSSTSALPLGNHSILIRATDNSGLYLDKIFIIKVIIPDAINQGDRQRLSSMGPNGNTAFNAMAPVNLAYNSVNNEFLTVWQADDNTGSLVDNELEIYGQRTNAATGANTGARIRISVMGTDGVANSNKGSNPSVAYNATNNEYFVVWQGDASVVGDEEIWAQRINASTGVLTGPALRISAMGTEGSNAFKAQNPDVSWNATNNQYFVVWRGDDNTAPLVDNENEIFGQLVSNTGTLSGSRVRISTMGPNGDINFAAFLPAVSYDQTDNKFLVVWRADDNTAPLVDNDYEIFGQMLTNAGVLSGSRMRISTMGPDGVSTYISNAPDVVWNSADNMFMVVWSGDDNANGLVDNENEIYGQLITPAGVFTGSRLRLSDMGPDGVSSFNAITPRVAYNGSLNEYWVVWAGDDDFTSIDGENEIFMQRITAAGLETGINDNRISYMGATASISFTAVQPAIAYSTSNFRAFTAWTGDDNTAPLVDNENEVFGQSLFINSALPVTWLDFTATLQENLTGLLHWQSASEVNAKEFVVQRSATAGNWTAIGTRPAAGNSAAVSDYQFTDSKPQVGKNYYRLAQVDVDGHTTFSKVVLMEYAASGVFSFFPNPSYKYLTVALPGTGPSSVRFYSQQGQLVFTQTYSTRQYVIDVAPLSAGMYYVQIKQKGITYNRSFLKK